MPRCGRAGYGAGVAARVRDDPQAARLGRAARVLAQRDHLPFARWREPARARRCLGRLRCARSVLRARLALRSRRRGVLRAQIAVAACFLVAGCASAMPGPSVTTTASGMAEQMPVTVSKPDGRGPFAYPRCSMQSRVYRPVAPLLILIGDK